MVTGAREMGGTSGMLGLLALPTLPHVPDTDDEFSKPHPERHPIYRSNIVRL
jgi:hypothetical protein